MLLLTSTKTMVNVELLTTNLNKFHIIGSYKHSRKQFHYPSCMFECIHSSKGLAHTCRGYHIKIMEFFGLTALLGKYL